MDEQEKQYEVKITEHAEQSMREIGMYIAVELKAPETAAKMLKTFQTGVAGLSIMPQRVHLTPEEPWRSLGIRRLHIKNYYAYFWIDEAIHRIQIMDFVYVGRDQEKQLKACSELLMKPRAEDKGGPAVSDTLKKE